MIVTYQDFEQAEDVTKFVESAISSYKNSDDYRIAVMADEYDAQRNPTITNVIKTLYTIAGAKVQDFTASNHRIACNIFNTLNTRRCMYSLGKGISFIDPYEAAKGLADTTKELLGPHFEHTITEGAYHALIHGCSYLFWSLDRVYEFTKREFVPLDDESDGSLRAGIRFWQLAPNKPLNAVLYEIDGYTKFATVGGRFQIVQEKQAYKVSYTYTDAGDVVSTDEENYTALPVVRMYASRLKQSTLVGMREAIDAYDLILSGFANDLTDCAQIYWLVENYGGMTDEDLAQFLDRLKLNHVANADTQAGGKITPYTQEVPYQARQAFLDAMRAQLYEDFDVLDVRTVAAGDTDDHVAMAYQYMDDRAADFEHWVSEAIMRLLELQGVEDVPMFQRNQTSNEGEQVDMVLKEAEYLDEQTILRKLPNITPDDAAAIALARENDDMERFNVAVPISSIPSE